MTPGDSDVKNMVLTVDPLSAWEIVMDCHQRIVNDEFAADYRGPVLIHASGDLEQIEAQLSWFKSNTGYDPPSRKDLESIAGQIIGRVDLEECLDPTDVSASDRPFAQGPVCWLLTNPVRFAESCEVGGDMPGLWNISPADLRSAGMSIAC